MKSIEIRLTVQTRKDMEYRESRFKTELRLWDDTTIGDIAAFTKNCKIMWNKVMAAAKDTQTDHEIEMEVISSTYSGWGEPGVETRQTSFNRWYSRGIDDVSTEKGEESIYLVPDTRYTAEHWDLLIQRDVLGSLSAI